MKYSSFERLVLVLGGASVLATLAVTYRTTIFVQEVVAQVMLFGVLFAAVHWGRRGGFIAAVLASITYIVVRIPLFDVASGVTPQMYATILTRVAAYGLIGIVGGELCTRMKYVLAGLENSSELDELTGIYSEQQMARLLDSAQARFERYHEPYAVVTVTVPGSAAPSTNRERAFVRQVAHHIRSDIRLMDEAGRIAEGRFVVLLPHTAKEGASVVAERLAKGVRAIARDNAAGVASTCVSADEDADAIQHLRAGLAAPVSVGQVEATA